MKNTKEVNGKDFEISRSAGDRVLSFSDDVCIGCGLCADTCHLTSGVTVIPESVLKSENTPTE